MTLIHDLPSLEDVAADSPDAIAVLPAPDEGPTQSYGELLLQARQVARALLRVAPTEGIVALSVTTRVPTFVLLHALLLARIPFAPLHPRLTTGERDALLQRLDPRLTLDDGALDALLHEAARLSSEALSLPRSPDPAAELLAIVPTSGTSGSPKLACLSRGAFAASARATSGVLGLSARDRWLLALPLCHVGGLSVLTRSLVTGASVVVLPRFEGPTIGAICRVTRPTLFPLVPTVLRDLLVGAEGPGVTLRACVVGGAACPDDLLDECARRGLAALTTYGLTEACSQVTLQPLRDGRRRMHGSGAAIPETSLTILRPDGSLAAPDEVGEIHVSGPTMMEGYLGEAKLASPFATGDFGRLGASGQLSVEGRRSDRIVTGGENVAPTEVEIAARAAPGVKDAVVFGVPDPRWGETVALCVVIDDALFDEAVLWQRLDERLAPFKRPKAWAIVTCIPTTTVGKVDRREARAVFGPSVASRRR